jgi:uncharacterized damage-inducible protein DinB
MPKQFRNGPVGALIDEYERAVGELKFTISNLNRHEFTEITDNDNNTVQSILNHVISSAYIYADLIRNAYNQPVKENRNLNLSENKDNYLHLLEHMVNDIINAFVIMRKYRKMI